MPSTRRLGLVDGQTRGLNMLRARTVATSLTRSIAPLEAAARSMPKMITMLTICKPIAAPHTAFKVPSSDCSLGCGRSRFPGLTSHRTPCKCGGATPTFKQVRAKEITSGTLNSLAFNSANTAGNLIVVYLAWTNTNSVSLTDTRGNVYTQCGSRTTWARTQTEARRCSTRRTSPEAPTRSSDFRDCHLIVADMYIHEYSGIDKANPFDVNAVNKGTTATMNSGSATTTKRTT